ncbi:MAG: shikimate dehydrogenase [Dehalococcoidia bacterium]|nr:shikimate dehydrogenase [Dehalococcoidia bacterium]
MNAHTKLCGIIGSPVRHTISPAMHNAAMTHIGINYAYLAFEVPSTNLKKSIEGMRAMEITGLNVTIPHKVAVLPLLDEQDTLAQDVGAVNTIVNQNGRLKGYNTDVGGFIEALKAVAFDAKGKHVLLLGAGGAARAMGFALAQQDACISILSRPTHMEQARLLAQNLTQLGKEPVKALELNDNNLKSELSAATLLVNATSAGMAPNVTETPVSASLLRPELVVFDVVYTPLETRLLKEARRIGCTTASGLDMLVRQGALSFKLWTGYDAPQDVMMRAALAELEDTKRTKSRAKGSMPKTSIAIIGFMGSGKSSVGQALAQELDLPFVDIDQLIEKETGQSIGHIFAGEGEGAFRVLEKDVIRRMSGKKGQVIACGGGAALDATNIAALKKHAVVIYLKCSPDIIKRRLATSRWHRPLLAGEDWMEGAGKLMAQRAPHYAQAADITIECGTADIAATARRIIKKLETYESFNF